MPPKDDPRSPMELKKVAEGRIESAQEYRSRKADDPRSEREHGWTDVEIAERNRLVSDAQMKICRIARLSSTGHHGIDFFDAIMEVYLAGRDAGWDAAIDAAVKVAHERALLNKGFADRFDSRDQQVMVDRALANHAEAQRIAAAILALKGDRNVEQSGT